MNARRATAQDARGIAAIHVESWESAYHGIVPEEYLRWLSMDHRERIWRDALEGTGPETWVVEENGDVRGWMSVAMSRDSDAPPSTGELWQTTSIQRIGAGGWANCWDTAEAQLKHSGFTEVTLWVFKDNEPALAFYSLERVRR